MTVKSKASNTVSDKVIRRTEKGTIALLTKETKVADLKLKAAMLFNPKLGACLMTEKKWPKLSRNDPKLNSMRFLVLECKLGDDLVFEMRLYHVCQAHGETALLAEQSSTLEDLIKQSKSGTSRRARRRKAGKENSKEDNSEGMP